MTAADEEKTLLGTGKRCLVISPIGDEFAAFGTDAHQLWANNIQLWEKVFKPVCESFDLDVIRSDKITETGDIPEQIFTLLRDAEVVIADVSGGNANVMYELGIRHTKNLLTVQVGEHARLPFDINTIRTIQFQRTEAGFIDLRSRLMATLEKGLQGDYSPVRATQVFDLQAPPLDQETVAQAVAKSQVSDDEDSEDEAGFLDNLADAEESIQEVVKVLEEIGSELTMIGAIMTDAKQNLAASDKAKKGFAGRVLIARQVAREIGEPVETLELLGEEFDGHMQVATMMVDYAVSQLTEDPWQVDDVQGFADQVAPVSEVAENFSNSVAEIAQAAREIQKISRDLKEPGKQLERAMGRIMNGLQRVVEWRVRLEEAATTARMIVNAQANKGRASGKA